MYATIEASIITAITFGVPPANTSAIYYVNLSHIVPAPLTGWYFNDDCQTFSATAPVIPAGEIAPPYTPGGTPPVVGGPTYPNPELPPEDDPAPLANTAPFWISFHADGVTNVSITGGANYIEVAARMRTIVRIQDICAARIQAHVSTAAADLQLFLCASVDAGVTWLPLSAGGTGPNVPLAATGTLAGAFLNVDPALSGDVLVNVCVKGSKSAVVGNVLACFYVKTTDGGCVQIDEPTGCALTGTFDEGVNFNDYANYTAFDNARPVGNLFGFWAVDPPDAAAVELQSDNHGNHLVLHHNNGGTPRNAYWYSTGLPYTITMAAMQETALDPSAASVFSPNTPSGETGLMLFRNGDTFINLRLANDRVYAGRFQGIDIGPASALCDGTPKRIIFELIETRSTPPGSVGVHVNVYVDDACAVGDPTFFGGTTQSFNALEGPFTQIAVNECIDNEPTSNQRVYKYAVGIDSLAFEVL